MHDSILVKPHLFQTLVLALIDKKYNIGTIDKAAELEPTVADELESHNYDLDTLISALKDPDDYPQLHPFINSSLRGTNVGSARAVRLLYLAKVI